VVRPGPNISPRSLRESAHAIRVLAYDDRTIEMISPVLLKSRMAILDEVACELCACATALEVKRPWYSFHWLKELV
jgi:hypothetical protein